MPSSSDRKRLEVPTHLYDQLVEIAVDEDRTVASVVQEILSAGLAAYEPALQSDREIARFTASARAALSYAREETIPLNHNYIGTEHILLGLLRAEDGIAAQVLTTLGVDLDRCREFIGFMIGRGRGVASAVEHRRFVPRARKTLRLAMEEAERADAAFVGTEHLLLALIRVDDGMAAKILGSLSVLGAVRKETLQVMRQFGDNAARVTAV